MTTPTPPSDDPRVATRADALKREQAADGTVPEVDPATQAAAILADSDARAADRNAAPGTFVEHRRSEETVDPV